MEGRSASGRFRRVRYVAPALIAVLLAACSPPLDESFGNGTGVAAVAQADTRLWNTPIGIAVEPDGQILVAFESRFMSGWLVLARFNADGTPDVEFGVNGVAETGQPGYQTCSDLELQPDGKMLVSGLVTLEGASQQSSAVARYNEDGTLDTSFGTSGYATLSGQYGAMCSLALQADGAILASGGFFAPYTGLARFTPSGVLDTSYGDDGIAFIPAELSASIEEMAVLPDGKVLTAGGAEENSQFAFRRLNPDGSVDTTFDGDGAASFDLGGHAVDLAVRDDGRFVAVGNSRQFSDERASRFLVAQFTPDGQVDTAFGQDGTATAVDDGEARALALLDDGRVMVVGGNGRTVCAEPGPYDGVILARFTADGRLDRGWMHKGVGMTSVYAGAESGYELAVQSDGKLVAVGRIPGHPELSPVGMDVGVYRFTAEGIAG